MIRMEEKGDKVYIYVKDEDNEIEPIEWTVIVNKPDFEWCVKKKEEAGYEDPVGSAMLDYAISDNCFIPKKETPREKAMKIFNNIILEIVQGSDDEIKVLEELKDVINDYIFAYSGDE
ncbi:C117 [Sulfolobus spindle-shaped virus Lassen]|nr:C117 [Sulfolobus spindle-shaped virus Lassen]